MKLGDKIWLWTNKKLPTRHSRYSAQAFCWMFAGIMLCLAGQSALSWWATAVFSEGVPNPWGIPFAVFFGLAALMVVAVYIADRRQGYLDAVHKHHLLRWGGRREKILRKRQKS